MLRRFAVVRFVVLAGSAVVGAMMVAPTDASAQYVRPTTILVPGKLAPQVEQGLLEVVKDRWSGSPLAVRTFFEGTTAVARDLAVTGGKSDTSLIANGAVVGAGRTILARQFQVGPEFAWRTDTLQARARYSLSFEQASREARRVGGPNPIILNVLLNNYAFVMSTDTGAVGYSVTVKSDTIKPPPDAKDQTVKIVPTYTVATKITTSVFRLNFDSIATVERELSPYFCDGCADRDQRRDAFMRYGVPMQHVAGFSLSGVGTARTEEAAAREAVEDALEGIVPTTAGKIKAFAIAARLIAERPAAARIGRKEGITRADRYFVYHSEQNADGKVTERRGAMLLADRVANNTGDVFEASATTVKAARFDSTTFKKVYPGKLETGSLIREKPTFVSVYVGYLSESGSSGLSVGARDETALGGTLPLPLKVGLLYRYIPGDSYSLPGLSYDPRVSDNTVHGEVGWELYPLAGKFRVMPVVSLIGNRFSDGISENDDPEEGSGYVKNPAEKWKGGLGFGLDAGVRLTPGVELTAQWRKATIFSDESSAGGVPQLNALSFSNLSFGVRVQP